MKAKHNIVPWPLTAEGGGTIASSIPDPLALNYGGLDTRLDIQVYISKIIKLSVPIKTTCSFCVPSISVTSTKPRML